MYPVLYDVRSIFGIIHFQNLATIFVVVAGSQWVRAVAGERKMQRLPLSIAVGSLCLLLSVAEVVVGGGRSSVAGGGEGEGGGGSPLVVGSVPSVWSKEMG